MQLALDIAAGPGVAVACRRRPEPAPHPDLGVLLEAFLATIAWGPTRAVYRQDLACYVAWCDANGLDPLRVSRESLDRWRDWMLHSQVDGRTAAPHARRVGLSGSVVRKRIGVVSRLFDYLIDRRLRADNPARAVERPLAQDPDAPPPRWLSALETTAMLDAAQALGPIQHVLACLLFAYGQPAVHVGELCGRDVFKRDGKPHIQLTVRKGRKLTQPLVGRTGRAILELGPLEADEPLVWLPGDAKRDAFRRRVTRVIDACARLAGIQHMTLIVVRHTWQALARAADVPERVITLHCGYEWTGREQWLSSADASVAVERHLAQHGA
jgi:site-specific recombinase XerD